MKGDRATDWIYRLFRASAVAAFVALCGIAVNATTAPVFAADGPKDPPAFSGTTRPFIFLKTPRVVPFGPFRDAAGKPVTLERFKGKVLLVNFWATWCGPCIHEMPTLDRLQGALGGKKFAVLTVSLDRKGLEKVAPFWKEQKVKHLPILMDRRWKTARKLGVTSLPATFLLDHTGRIVGYLIGPAVWDSEQAKAFIRFYIDRAKQTF